MSAEYCLKKWLYDNHIHHVGVGSVGIKEHKGTMNKALYRTLLGLGADPSFHEQRIISKKHIVMNDFIIAMAKNHQEYIKSQFNRDVPLFNELAHGRRHSVLDVGDKVIDPLNNPNMVDKYMTKTARYIHASIPKLVQSIPGIR